MDLSAAAVTAWLQVVPHLLTARSAFNLLFTLIGLMEYLYSSIIRSSVAMKQKSLSVDII